MTLLYFRCKINKKKRIRIGNEEKNSYKAAFFISFDAYLAISVAIITYCLVAIVHHDMQLKCSTYEVLQILSISLMDKTHLRDLFDKTIFNDVKELDYPLFKGLFD